MKEAPVNSHTFWSREIIWLHIVYFFKLFIDDDKVKDLVYLEVAFVIELAYVFCLRKEEL